MQKVVVVTGGSSGIGAATCRMLGAEGAHVVVNYRANRDEADGVVADVVKAGGKAIAVRGDVGIEADIVSLFQACDRAFGPPTGLVNNAAVGSPKLQKVEDYEMDEVMRVLRINTASVLICCREAVKRMATRNGGKGGAIVNVSSVGAVTGSPDRFIHYAGSKAAVDIMTVGMASELARHGVRVNAIRPGLIDTPMHAKVGQPDRVRNTQQATPLGRAGTPEEVAESIVWLLSDKASFVSGAILNVMGGPR
jgi:NAD(P)-dependent dehydrogenase (short-subunit alcohol dehydrogenase family)